MLMRISELGCRALIEIVFESISVRRQVGYLTVWSSVTERIENMYVWQYSGVYHCGH